MRNDYTDERVNVRKKEREKDFFFFAKFSNLVCIALIIYE